MSKPGKYLLVGGFAFLLLLFIFRVTYQGWHDSMWVPLVLGLGLSISGLVRDRTAVSQFFTMRTTKHGLNMGAIIVGAVIGMICLNILAVRYEKKFDWTSDRLNTLSDQSMKAAKGLRKETRLVLLFRSNEVGGENVQKAVSDLAKMYMNESGKITFQTVNALQDPGEAQKFDYTAGPFALFAVQGDQKVKIDQPTEEGVTRALIKLSRESKKVLYLTMGHGERDPQSTSEDGISFFKEQLEVTYEVRNLTLYQTGNKVPEDAAAVLVIRPNQQFLDPELQALRDYASRGGHLFIAIDPGMKHNLAQVTKTFGIEFNNDYVLDQRAQLIQMGAATVLGSTFPAASDITKAFGEGQFGVFFIASSLKKAPDAAATLTVEPLLATDNGTMSTPELGKVVYKANGPQTLAMTSTTTSSMTTAGPTASTSFSVVVIGDSDFLSNRLIQNNLNNDFALNSVAWLTNDKDLISIRPKQAKGSTLEMTSEKFNFYVLGFLLPMPFALFAIGGFMWWRRRTA
ncbi:MAG: hypothetical protein EOP05_06455 [Proteobacteria bacterium]|nr:MAG: hypothetical protein EOP05_06455 [Pseudomonadota bacterium]